MFRPHPGAQERFFNELPRERILMGGTGYGSRAHVGSAATWHKHLQELIKIMENDQGPVGNPEDNVGRRKYYPGDVKGELSRIRRNLNRNHYGNMTDTAVGMLNREITAVEMKLETMEDDHPEAFMKIEIERQSHLPKSATQLMDEEQQRIETIDFPPPPMREVQYPLLVGREPLVFDHPVGSWNDLTDDEKDRFYKYYQLPDYLNPDHTPRVAVQIRNQAWIQAAVESADDEMRERAKKLANSALELAILQKELQVAVADLQDDVEETERTDAGTDETDTKIQSTDGDPGSAG